MTDKELRRLNRAELLQLLLEQSKENEQLQAKITELTEQAERQSITCQDVGSIAEAALKLNGVFQAADQAAQNYIQEVAARTACQEKELEEKVAQARAQADALVSQAREQADRILEDAQISAGKTREEAEACLNEAKIHKEAVLAEAEVLLEKARADADACTAQAKVESEEYWNKVREQIQVLLQGQDTLKAIFLSAGKNTNL